jgi:hypothetical protein
MRLCGAVSAAFNTRDHLAPGVPGRSGRPVADAHLPACTLGGAEVTLRYLVALVVVSVLAAGCAARRPVPPLPPPAARPGPSCGEACGSERWAVKTLSDQDAGLVDLQAPEPASVASLVARVRPPHLPEDRRVRPTETTLFRVEARLLGYVREADGDIHVVLGDATDPGLTMIAEIPDADLCAGACSSVAAARFRAARAAFLAPFGATAPRRYCALADDVRVEVTGVGFFDVPHHQTGLAPNAIELHPVVAVQFTSGAPRAGCKGPSRRDGSPLTREGATVR